MAHQSSLSLTLPHCHQFLIVHSSPLLLTSLHSISLLLTPLHSISLTFIPPHSF